jgi:large subunit ribosomal protein L3
MTDSAEQDRAMPLGLLGKKVGMTQVIAEDGRMIPVTVLNVGPCTVIQVRDQKRDGYDAVQLGFEEKRRQVATRAQRGHVSAKLESKRRKALTTAGVALPPKADCEPPRYLREFRLSEPATLEVGKVLTAQDVFDGVKAVDVVANTKGRGYTGVMKRHNYAGQPAAHGAKKVHRAIGSIASLASNRGGGRPKKGRKMAGQYGNERVTVQNQKIARVMDDEWVLLVAGAVPGPRGGIVTVRGAVKKKMGGRANVA